MQTLNLKKEEEVLLNLISLNVNGKGADKFLTKEYLDGVDWRVVIKESIEQSVALCAFDACACYKEYIPQDLFAKWKEYAVRVMQTGVKVVASQEELMRILGDKYPYVILKGLSACSYYLRPELRALGDVDFLIEPSDQKEIEQILIDNGYELSCGDHPNHVVFKKANAHLEMHFEVAGVPYGKVGEKVKEFLKGAVLRADKKTYDHVVFNAPNEVDHALVLLLHMQHHMLGEGFGLRHLSDWASFVNKTCNESFWQAQLIPFLEEIGLYTYAKVMTKTCSLYIGSVCPDWAQNVDEKLCFEIINDILLSGNFGRKDENRAKSGMLISEHGKTGTKRSGLYNMAHALHKAVLRKPAVKKCIILYPFVYFYKAVRFLFLSLIGKRPSIIKMMPEAEKRKEIYDKLQIFETSTQEK